MNDDELPHIQRATTSGILAFFAEVEALMVAERETERLERPTDEPRPTPPPAQTQ